MARTVEQAWAKPEYEVLCHIGTSNGAVQVAQLEHKGRSVWKCKATAQRHANDYQAAHKRLAYVSAC